MRHRELLFRPGQYRSWRELADAETGGGRMSDEPKRCPACKGRGYFTCDCWPGDCFCGFGDESCEECCGEGWVYPDDDALELIDDDLQLEADE